MAEYSPILDQVALKVLFTHGHNETAEFSTASSIAESLLAGVNKPDILSAVHEANAPGVSSHSGQAAIISVAEGLGFVSERSGLFTAYTVSALRPDYYRRLRQTGILFEVERGKTLNNNMGLLDLWKCHICPQASILFLFVPKLLQQNQSEKPKPVFAAVVNRLGTFFLESNETNVSSAFIFGY